MDAFSLCFFGKYEAQVLRLDFNYSSTVGCSFGIEHKAYYGDRHDQLRLGFASEVCSWCSRRSSMTAVW